MPGACRSSGIALTLHFKSCLWLVFQPLQPSWLQGPCLCTAAMLHPLTTALPCLARRQCAVSFQQRQMLVRLQGPIPAKQWHSRSISSCLAVRLEQSDGKMLCSAGISKQGKMAPLAPTSHRLGKSQAAQNGIEASADAAEQEETCNCWQGRGSIVGSASA